jgi:hypothetical protein
MNKLLPSEILIVVLHTLQEPWEEIVQKGQFETWVPKAIKEGYKISYCFGPRPTRLVKKIDYWNENLRWHKGARVSTLRNQANKVLAKPFLRHVPATYSYGYLGAPEGVDCITLKVWDLYLTGRWKMLAVFNYFLQQPQSKYLVILTSAAYLRPQLLRETLTKLDGETIYAGPIIQKNSKTPFVSGAQLVVNRKFAEISVTNPAFFPGEKLNDLSLALAAEKMGVNPIELPTINFSSLEEIQNAEEGAIRANYHFRLKSFKFGKRNDVELFLKLKEKIESIE